jgi:UDP-N-acetylmuramoylalanine--D-glutamate ligase
VTFSAGGEDADYTLAEGWICRRGERIVKQDETRLPGLHNAENLMAAFAIGAGLGVADADLATAIGDFRPPVHRCESVRELDGVRWVNDSKATNLDAVQMALRSQGGPVVLICGGKDKGFGFDPLLPLVREKVRVAVLIGEMRERIAQAWPGVDCRPCESLEAAVTEARRAARSGDTVLLSPGTSSFDMFRNYGERGERFKAAVAALTTEPKNQP